MTKVDSNMKHFNQPKVTVVKAGSPTVVKSGYGVTYTITIENKGDILVENFYIKDVIPEGMTLTGSFILNKGELCQLPQNMSIETGLVLDFIAPNTEAVISYGCYVNTVPPFELINDFQYSYEYLEGGKLVGVGPIEGNKVKVNGIFEEIKVEKKARLAKECCAAFDDSFNVKPGALVNFQVTVTNTLEVPITSGILNDYLPPTLQILPKSVYVDRKRITWEEGPLVNFPLGDLMPKEERTITYNAIALGPEGYIINNVTAFFDSSLGIVGSNTYLLGLIYSVILALKACPEEAVYGQSITYTHIIKNDSKEVLRSIRLFDVLPDALSFISGSACVNGIPQGEAKKIEDIVIPNLESGSHHIVVFKAFITEKVPYVVNSATLGYIQGDRLTGFSMDSNSVMVKVKKS